MPLEMIQVANIAPEDIVKNKNEGCKFYKDMAYAWAKLNFHKPVGRDDALQQPIWYNSCIKIAGRTCSTSMNNMIIVKQVKDLYDIQTEQWKTVEQIQSYENLKLNYLEIFSLISAIPKVWSRLIKLKLDSTSASTMQEKISKVGKMSKWAYWQFIDNTTDLDTGIRAKWEIELQCEVTNHSWNTMFRRIGQLTIATKLRAFQFRLTNRILVTNIQLERWKIKPNALCSFCGKELESYKHLFVTCTTVLLKIWRPLRRWVDYYCNVQIDIDAYTILFNMYKDAFADMINTIILITKHFIYVKRCLQHSLNFTELIASISEFKNLEYVIAQRKRIQSKHQKKWLMYDLV